MKNWPGAIGGETSPRAPVVLAHELPFTLGALQVEPALRRISTDQGDEEIVQPRTMQVLVALARADGAIVTRDDLTVSCWSGTVVGDDSINRVIAQLRRIAQGIGAGRFTLETITKVGYRLLDTAQPSTPELPPAGEPFAPPDASPVSASLGWHSRRIVIACALVAALVAMVLGLRAWLARPTPDRIALKSFDVIGSGVADGFAPALREEILAAFGADSRVQLDLAGPRRGEPALTGSIERGSDGGVVVLARLLDADGNPVWSPRLSSTAASPTSAARAVAGSLTDGIRCVWQGTRGALPPAPMAQWTRACELNAQDSDGNSPSATELLRDVTRAAPGFAPGWSALGAALADRVQWGEKDLRGEAEQAVSQALRLDSENADAWEAKAYLLPPFAHAAREALYRKATQVRPSDCGCEHHMLAYFLTSVGRWRDAVPEYARAVDMAPNHSASQVKLAEALAATGQAGEAQRRFTDLVRTYPEDPTILGFAIDAALWMHDYSGALRLLVSMPDSVGTRNAMVMVRAMRDHDTAALALAAQDRLRMMATGDYSLVSVQLMGEAGEGEAILPLLDRRIAKDGPLILPMLFSPAMAQARHSLAFAALTRKYGLIDYWRTSRQPPDFCREAVPPSLCATLH